MNQPKVLVVVLNWQQPETTLNCVRTLKAMAPPLPQILVVDNGSADNSVEILSAALPADHLQLLPSNLGFAGGMNAGLRYAMENDFDYALLMNNDAFADANMLNRLLAEAEPDIGLLSPMIFYRTAPERIWFAGGRRHRALLELRDRKQGAKYSPEMHQSQDVDYLLGTCLLANMTAVQKVGLLDEDFFMYYEDLDWSIRFQQHGYRLRMIADAHLFHEVAISTGGTDSPSRRYYLAHSSVCFYRRHAKLGRPFFILLFRLGSAIKMVARLTLAGQIASALAYIRGLRDGILKTKHKIG